MTKIMVFDFIRTLYDPEKDKLVEGALELIARAREKGYILILQSKTGEGRMKQIELLGISECFDHIELVDSKSPEMIRGYLKRYDADAERSVIIGDRAQSELAAGHAAGIRTIWYRSGRFADEHPEGFTPMRVVTHLREAESLLI